ncbi:MAG TPA: hypothetical protein VKC15_12865, partial [Gemmatimonadales bacterium]|nr:hypothetical protein [Gemmatimonadales bacterium]
ASQLAKAKARGKVDFRTVIVVDRNPDCRARRELGDAPDRRYVTQDWTSFFDAFFDASLDASDDFIVPSPHMPHLMFEWVLGRARQRWPKRTITVEPVPGDIGTPYDRTAQDATRYVSFADWICPTHCIEPALCPAIGAPRTWEMGDAVRALADRLRGAGQAVAGPALFVCKHHVFGVGTFAVEAVLAGDRLVAETGASGARAGVLVGTISSCHGAVNLLRLGAQ